MSSNRVGTPKAASPVQTATSQIEANVNPEASVGTPVAGEASTLKVTPGSATVSLGAMNAFAKTATDTVTAGSAKVSAGDMRAFANSASSSAMRQFALTPSKIADQETDAQSTSNVFTVTAQDKFRQEAIDDDGYLPNMLNDYMNVAYHARFFIADIGAYRNALGPTESLTFAKAVSAMDTVPKIIIAESGATVGLNIRDISFTQFMVRNNELNASQSDWTMTIKEPLGTMFFDVMRNSALKLGIESPNDCPYFVELSFKGYDADGTPITNLLADMKPNGGRFLFRLFITNVETSLDESGATHKLSLATTSMYGMAGQEGGQAQAMISIQASTVGEFFDKLAKELTAAQDLRYGTDATSGHYMEYKFFIKPVVHGNDDDPSKWSIIPLEIEKNPQQMLSFTEGQVPTMNIPPGTSVGEIIKMVFSNTEEAQRYAKSLPITDELAESDKKTNAERFKEAMFLTPTINVVEGEIHPITRKYKRVLEYVISPYWSQAAVTTPQERTDARDPEVQSKMLASLRSKGFLRKRYDYYYTGMNTDIMSLDISTDMRWSAVMPNLLGYRLNGQMTSIHGQYNETRLSAQDIHTKFIAMNDELNKAKAGVQEARANNSEDSEAVQTALASEQKTQQQLDLLGRQRADAMRTLEQDRNPRSDIGGDDLVFAEELTTTPSYEEIDVDIPITQWTPNSKDASQAGMSSQYHRDRGVFSAIYEQIAASGSNALATIQMEIKGDPFWIGYTNIEAAAYAGENSPNQDAAHQQARYHEGDNTFLLYVGYPSGIDENGNPIFQNFPDEPTKRRDAFSGYYRVWRVVNIFEGGQFKQRLEAQKLPLITLSASAGFSAYEDELTGQTSSNTPAEGRTADAGPNTAGGLGPDIKPGGQPRANEKQVYDYFIKKGYSPQAAAGIVGNLITESGLNPSAYNPDDKGKPAYGLAQWRDRLPALKTWAKRNNRDPNTLEAQLDFMDFELKGTESRADARIRKATTVKEGTAAMLYFERPQNYQTITGAAGWSDRLRNAERVYQTYGGK